CAPPLADGARSVVFFPASPRPRPAACDPPRGRTFSPRLHIEPLPRRKALAATQRLDRAAAIRSAVRTDVATLVAGNDLHIRQHTDSGAFPCLAWRILGLALPSSIDACNRAVDPAADGAEQPVRSRRLRWRGCRRFRRRGRGLLRLCGARFLGRLLLRRRRGREAKQQAKREYRPRAGARRTRS